MYELSGLVGGSGATVPTLREYLWEGLPGRVLSGRAAQVSAVSVPLPELPDQQYGVRAMPQELGDAVPESRGAEVLRAVPAGDVRQRERADMRSVLAELPGVLGHPGYLHEVPQ